MAVPIFAARITLNGSNTVSEDTFDLTFTVTDSEGIFSGLDVMVGDYVFLDTSGVEIGTITKYIVQSITSQDFTDVTATVVFGDNNPSPIDPSVAVFTDGFISRPTPQEGFTIIPDPQIQFLPNKFAILPKNADFEQKLDSDIGGAGDWQKFTVTYEDLAAAAFSNSITLFELQPMQMISKVIMKHSEIFGGGTIDVYVLRIGITGDLDPYASSFDVTVPVSNSASQISVIDEVESYDGETDVLLTADCSGSNLATADQGSVDIWVLLENLE